MNRCLKFFRTDGFIKVTACDNVKNEFKRLMNYQYSPALREKGIIEECVLLLSVDDADMLRDCIIERAYSMPRGVDAHKGDIYIDDYSLIQILANNECTYYEDSVGKLYSNILKQRKIYNFFKSYDCVGTVQISQLIHLNDNLYKDNNGFIFVKDGSPDFQLWYLMLENEKILFGLSFDSSVINQITDNRVNPSESRFAHRINEKFFDEYNNKYAK